MAGDYLINHGPIPPCPSPKPRVTVTSFRDDGRHHWGNEQVIGTCYYQYTCAECGTIMRVDSSD